MKRSRNIGRFGLIALSTVSVMALSGCLEEEANAQSVTPAQHETAVYSSMEACLADAQKVAFPEGTAQAEVASQKQTLELACINDWREAQAEHEKSAPRYSSLAQCEAEFGDGNCGAPGQSSGTVASSGGSDSNIFMPVLMGYMLGNMMSNNGGGYRSGPVYSDRSGGYRSTQPSMTNRLKTSGATYVAPTGSRSDLSTTRATNGRVATPATTPKSTMQTSTRTRSQGFGASRSSTSRSGWGG